MRNKISYCLLLVISLHCSSKNLNTEQQEKFMKAHISFLENRVQDTIVTLENLTQENPDYFPAYLLLIQAYYFQNLYQQALSKISLARKNNQVRDELDYWEAKVLLKENNANSRQKALHLLKRLQEENPYHSLYCLELGNYYKQNLQYKEALYYYRLMLVGEEDYLHARMAILSIYNSIGDKTKISEQLELLKKPYFDLLASEELKNEIKKLNLTHK